MFDLCVVGAGMIGTAAARHASKDPEVKVCLVGPSEPKTRTTRDTRDIYASHYDEGRITLECDPDPVWALLAQKSIARYRDLEKLSGTEFYKEVGALIIVTKDNEHITKIKQNAKDQNVPLRTLSNVELTEKFPYLKLRNDDVGVIEYQNAGHISPRKLVEAQKKVSKDQGCTVIEDIVCSVERQVQNDGSYVMKVLTEGGNEIYSKAVLLATGAFTNFRNVLPGLQTDQRVRGLTIALIEVDKVDEINLKAMPAVTYLGEGHPDWHTFLNHGSGKPSLAFYMLPPIKYPDGRVYIKLGRTHGSLPLHLTTAEAVKRWFVNGNVDLAEHIAKFTASVIKDLKLKNWHGDYCVVMVTPTARPYIDTVHDQLGVAIGGNGYAAKSSDEIGRMAANMMFGRWDSEIPRDVFKLRLANNTSSMSKL